MFKFKKFLFTAALIMIAAAATKAQIVQPNDILFNGAMINQAGTYNINFNNDEVVFLLLEDLEDDYDGTVPIVVNLNLINPSSTSDRLGNYCIGTFPIFTYTDTDFSHRFGGFGIFGVGGISNPRIFVNNTYIGKARENDTINILTTDNVKIEVSKIFRDAGIVVNSSPLEELGGQVIWLERDVNTNNWGLPENELTGQDILSLNQGIYEGNNYADFWVTGYTHEGGSWLTGIPFTIKILPAPDITSPTASVSYSTQSPTNQDVGVTLTFSEKVQALAGWQMLQNDSIFTKTYPQNTIETVTFADLAGNQGSAEIRIENIDKTPPVITSITHAVQANYTAIITITATDEGSGIAEYGIGGGSFQQGNTFTISQNFTYTLFVRDYAGNAAWQQYTVSDIPVPAAVTGVTLSHTAATLSVGETLQLTAAVQPANAANQNLIWHPDVTVGWNSKIQVLSTTNSTLTIKATGAGVLTIIVASAENSIIAAGCTLTITAADGIDDIQANAVKIYPNPVKDELIIENGEFKIKNVEIVDITGRIILSTTLASQMSPTSLNIGHLTSGIYLLKITTDKGTITKKILKNK